MRREERREREREEEQEKKEKKERREKREKKREKRREEEGKRGKKERESKRESKREREREEEREKRKPPCVDSKRLRVYGQDVSVCTGNARMCSTHAGPTPKDGTDGDVILPMDFEHAHGRAFRS